MADVAIVNISELNPTASQLGSMLIAVEVVGQGIKKISKDEFFKVFGTSLAVTSSPGSTPFVTIQGQPQNISFLTGGYFIVKANRTYFSTDGSTDGIYIDAESEILSVFGKSGTGKIQMNKNGADVVRLILDENFTGSKDAYLGTSLDQQLIYNGSLPTASAQLAASCQRSILKIKTATATNSQNDIYFPASPKDGYTFELTISGTITALTLLSGANTIDGTLTTASNTYNKWCYDLDTTTWLKLI